MRADVTISKHLLGRGMEDREVLTIQFPRYVWVIRSESGDEDIVVDATSPMLLRYCRINLVTGEFSYWTLP